MVSRTCARTRSLCYNGYMKAFPLAALVLALAGPAGAQAPAAPVAAAPAVPMFPFVMPWDDAAPGTITDVSFLNARPAGVNGYIVPRGGHFVESKTGHRVRFLATNFGATQAFPNHADAEKEAAHLAKQGYNLVRLHHMDNNWAGAVGSIWDFSRADRQHISPAQLDKVDYLFAQLKKNGVYSNVNLHVSRQFSAADGFPESVSKIPFDFDKRVDEFDRRMIQLDKNYAHDLLTHVNPYTGLSYADDPAVAVIEINNENSLVGFPWGDGLGSGLDVLPEPFLGELVGFWNDWLTKKYRTDAGVQAAWTKGLTATGPGMLNDTMAWSIEHQGTSAATMSVPINLSYPHNIAPDLDAHVTQIDGTDWHVQVHQTGLDLHDGETYTVTFRAKADTARVMPLAAGLDQADWHNVGLTGNAALTTEWKTFHYVFTAHDTAPKHSRLAFTLGGQIGTVWISDLQIHPGAEGAGLPPGQSLATKTVGIPDGSLRAQHEDWISFLADTERAYADEMRAYLKDDLHVHANVICSQMGYGGLTSLGRNAAMEFADNHAYWQHPSFPHKAWDQTDWNIPNTAMVSDLAAGGAGTLRDLAEYRVAGKPYSVSEYNHPAPNDYRAEMMPELASFAAFQDWDMIYLFAQGDYGANAPTDKINGFFDLANDPSRTAFLPAAALIFRAGEIAPATDAAIVTVPRSRLVSLESAGGAWSAATGKGATKLSPFEERLGLALGGPKIQDVSLRQTAPRLPAAPAVALGRNAAGALYTANAPAALAFAGFVGGQTVTLGQNTLTFPAFGNGFAAMTLTAMDQRPLAQSGRVLLTLAGKVENQGMVWNADRTSVGDQWGHGPTVAEGIPATVALKTNAARHVWALDGAGKRAGEVPITFANGTLTFTVGPQFQTLWYEVGP